MAEQKAKKERKRKAQEGPAAEEAKVQLTAEQQKQQEELAAKIKEIEKAVIAVKLYPVAVNEKDKDEALGKLLGMYSSEGETVRQLIIYMVHDQLTKISDLKMMHSYDFVKMKNPGLGPAQIRMKVYKAMFNYNTSIEGLCEFIRFLGMCRGGDDAAKVLTHHYAHLSTQENEMNHVLRAAIIDALGMSDSMYALKALLEYAKYSDSERTMNRLTGAIKEWDAKLPELGLPAPEEDRLRGLLRGGRARGRGTQYG